MKKIVFGFIAVVALFFCTKAEAQTIKGKFKVAKQTGKQINLFRTEGNYKYIIDSTKVNADGTFSFTNKKYPLGYYKMSFGNENNMIDVILNSKEKEVELEFTQPFLERGIIVLKSIENKAYWEYKKKEIKTEKRKLIPAVTHIDGTGRLQTVKLSTNEKFYKLIDYFRQLTGIPVLLNTSFNLNGEPICCSPTDAIRTFYSSGLDVLVLSNFIIKKQS